MISTDKKDGSAGASPSQDGRSIWRGGVLALGLIASLLGGSLSAQDLPHQVNAAIDRGRAALLPELLAALKKPPADYPMGRIALMLAALLKSGIPSDHEAVGEAFEKLDSLPAEQTYSVACYLFALDGYWQARHRESRAKAVAQGRTGVGSDVPRVPPPGPVRSKMEELIRWLIRGQGGTWNYGHRGGGDLSNSQFAVLGLEIGLENDIVIPAEVFGAVADHLLRVEWKSATTKKLTITYRTPAWEGVTAGRLKSETYTVDVGGWEYRSNPAGPISLNMTAAGVSSLLIARRALKSLGECPLELEQRIDERIASGLGWMAANVSGYFGDYYGMYSLEKVGDIGGIVLFGPVDWYAEGARYLLRAQKRDGSWGNAVHTSFALLFLTRATRSPLQALGPPVLLTRGGERQREAEESESDLVFVPQVKGFLSARVLFTFLDETRDPLAIPLAEEAVKAYPPHRLHEALALVLSLWQGEADDVTRFARSEAARLTKVEKGERKDYAAIAAKLKRVRELERQGAAEAEEAARLLREGRGPVSKRRVLELIDRLGLIEAFEAVAEALADRDAEVSSRAEQLLSRWAQDAGGVGLVRQDETGQKAAAAARKSPEAERQYWQAWWGAHGEEIRLNRRLPRLLEEIEKEGRGEAGGDAKKADAWREIVKLGPSAVPYLLRAMEREECSIRLVEALEAITGESRGVRAAEWRTF